MASLEVEEDAARDEPVGEDEWSSLSKQRTHAPLAGLLLWYPSSASEPIAVRPFTDITASFDCNRQELWDHGSRRATDEHVPIGACLRPQLWRKRGRSAPRSRPGRNQDEFHLHLNIRDLTHLVTFLPRAVHLADFLACLGGGVIPADVSAKPDLKEGAARIGAGWVYREQLRGWHPHTSVYLSFERRSEEKLLSGPVVVLATRGQTLATGDEATPGIELVLRDDGSLAELSVRLLELRRLRDTPEVGSISSEFDNPASV